MIALCQTEQIDVSEIYTLILILESLILASRSWYLITRVFVGEVITDDNQESQKRFLLLKLLIIYLSDLLEGITTCIAIVSFLNDKTSFPNSFLKISNKISDEGLDHCH